jgi:hypothetical protein
MRERAGLSHYPAVIVDTSRRTFATASARKSEVMEKTNQERRRPRKLPWPPKLTLSKGNDCRSPALQWSLPILNMELRKNGRLEVGESILLNFFDLP